MYNKSIFVHSKSDEFIDSHAAGDIMSKSPDSSWTTAVPVSISLTRMHVRMLVFLSFEIACLPLSSFPTALISAVSVEI